MNYLFLNVSDHVILRQVVHIILYKILCISISTRISGIGRGATNYKSPHLKNFISTGNGWSNYLSQCKFAMGVLTT